MQVKQMQTATKQNKDNQSGSGMSFRHPEGFEQIFRQHYVPLCRYAGTLCGNKEDAEEMVQQVFVKIWETKETIEIESNLTGYLYRAVYHQFLNMVRKRKVTNMYEENMKGSMQVYTNPLDRTRNAELQQKLESALEKLPGQCRLIFKLNRFEELRYKEIANVLGLSIKTVENQMGKALKILRAELADYLPLMAAFGLINQI